MKKVLFFLLIFVISGIINIKAQIPNPSFEDWKTVNGILQPTGWNFLSGTGIPTTVTRSEPGVKSPYAVKFTVATLGSKPWCSHLQSKFKFTARPGAVTFYTKTTNTSDDSLIVSVAFFNNNYPIGSGEYTIKGSIPDFTEFGVKIQYFDQTTMPDSAYIYFGFESQAIHLGSEFYIDNLLHRESWGGVNDLDVSPFTVGSISPVPAIDFITIPVNITKPQEININIYDIVGNKLKSFNNKLYEIGNNNLKTDISYLPAGAYLIAIQTKEGYKVTKKFIVN